MQHNGQLAGERHFRLPHADSPGEPHRPALECSALDWLRQDDVGSLIESRAHRTVTHLADPQILLRQEALSPVLSAMQKTESYMRVVRSVRSIRMDQFFSRTGYSEVMVAAEPLTIGERMGLQQTGEVCTLVISCGNIQINAKTKC
jgi:hypothetical protein